MLKPRGRVTIFCHYCILYMAWGHIWPYAPIRWICNMTHQASNTSVRISAGGGMGDRCRGEEKKKQDGKNPANVISARVHIPPPPPFTHESYKFENQSKAIVISIVRAAQCRVQIRIKTGKLGFMVKTLQNVAFLFLKTVFLSGHFFCNLYFVTNVCSSTITNFW